MNVTDSVQQYILGDDCRPDSWPDVLVSYADYVALLSAKEQAERERDAALATRAEWIKENGPGGWIDDLRAERDALKALCADLVVAIQRLGLQADLSAHLAVLTRARSLL